MMHILKTVLKWIAIAAVVMFLIGTIYSYFHNKDAQRDLDELRQEMILQDIPMTKEELLRKPVSDDDNAFYAFEAIRSFEQSNSDSISDFEDYIYNVDINGYVYWPERIELIDDFRRIARDPVFTEYMALYDDVVERQNYWVDFRDIEGMGFVELLIPEVGTAKQGARFYLMRARAAIADQQFDSAFLDLEKALKLAGLLSQERTLVHQLSAVEIYNNVVDFIEQWTLNESLSDQELEKLRVLLHLPDTLPFLIRAIDAERILYGGAIFDMVRNGKAKEIASLSSSGDEANLATQIIFKISLFYMKGHNAYDEAFYIRYLGQIRTLLDERGLRAIQAIGALEEGRTTELKRKRYRFSAILLPTLGPVVERILITELNAVITRTALSLLQYHNDHGAYPETLDALVPEYMEAVPVDVFSGEALVYRRVDEGFQLYSLGPNQIDDGGYEDPEDPKDYDLAWKGRGAVAVEMPIVD